MVVDCKSLIVVAVSFVAAAALAFPSVPKASAKALGVTRGKSFTSGLVFINGKYVKPPYVVERWGTGLRINGRKISGEVIGWNEFIKTQAGVKVTKTAAPAASAAPAVEQTEDESSLDDLFDDAEKGAKKGGKKSARAPRKPAQPSVTYSFDGEFAPNATTKALVEKINAARTDIDKKLRIGGFFFFGDGYSRVAGDAGTAWKILKTLPEAQRDNESAAALASALRSAGFVFLSDALCQDLFRNRVDYRALMDRRDSWQQDAQVEKLLNN